MQSGYTWQSLRRARPVLCIHCPTARPSPSTRRDSAVVIVIVIVYLRPARTYFILHVWTSLLRNVIRVSYLVPLIEVLRHCRRAGQCCQRRHAGAHALRGEKRHGGRAIDSVLLTAGVEVAVRCVHAHGMLPDARFPLPAGSRRQRAGTCASVSSLCRRAQQAHWHVRRPRTRHGLAGSEAAELVGLRG